MLTSAVVAAMLAVLPVSVPTPASQPAADASESLPDARALFARHLEAIGGERAIRAHTNRVSRGAMTTFPSGEFALLTVWQEAPGRLHTRVERPGEPVIDTYFSEGYGWRVVGGNKAELITGEPLRELRDDADFFADVEFDRRYREMETVEKIREEDGTVVYRVHVVFSYGKDEMHYFNAETGLRQAVLTSTMTPEGQIPVAISYADYREVSGVRLPHEILMVINAGKENEQKTHIKFNAIKANVPSVPSWTMPKPLQDLVKQREEQEGGG